MEGWTDLFYRTLQATAGGPKNTSLTIQVKNLNSMVNKMNNTNSLMIRMKPKDVTKLGIVKLHKSEKHLQRKMHYLKMVYTDICISLVNNMEIRKTSYRLYLE